MEKYLEGEMPSKEELQRLCAEAVRQGTLTPIVCVSTKMGVGLDELLAVLAQASLPPTAVAADGEEGRRRRDAQVPIRPRRWPPRCSRRASIRSCSG